MSEWWLLALISSAILFFCMVLVIPIKSSKRLSVMLFPILMVMSVVGYLNWGSYPSWSEFLNMQQKNQVAQEMMKQFDDPQDVINQLKAKLDDSPQSAKGWYLLGRLYLNQEQLQNAIDAFAKAHDLQPEEEQYSVHYAHSLWENNQHKFTPQIRELVNSLLRKNSQQPDALAMLAMDAYTNQQYEQAIGYWRRLLSLAPESSNEARVLRKAIAKAEENIKASK